MLESTEKSTSISWLSLLGRSDGQRLGTGIERLARLAAAAHQQAIADEIAHTSKANRGEVER